MRRRGKSLRRMSKRTKALTVVSVIIVILVVLYSVFNMRIRPLIIQMAFSRVSNIATHAINDAITNEVSNGNIAYDKLIELEKDASGKVTALKTNMVEVNRLKAEVINKVLDQIEVYNTSDLNIPLGSVISENLFSGRGPKIPIRIVSVSSAGATLENVFTSAGINQTRHQIILTIKVNISILMAGSNATTSVESSMSVAETVIIGSVPESYAYFENTSSGEDALEKYYNYF